MRDDEDRNLFYVAGVGVGIGHFLTSASILKHYADRTHRRFHIICNKWVMSLDAKADIDPIYSMLFADDVVRPRPFNASLKLATDTIESQYQSKRPFLVIGINKHGLNRLSQNLDQPPFIDEAAFMTINKFRHLIADGIDHPIDNIVFDTVIPFQSDSRPFAFFRDIPPLSPLRYSAFDRGIDLNECVGLHIRHGNGEHLNRRTMGGSPEFDLLVEGIVSSARRIAEERSMRVIAFGDNPTLLDHLEREHGFIRLEKEENPEIPWRKRLDGGGGTEHKRRLVESAIRDIACLSRSRRGPPFPWSGRKWPRFRTGQSPWE